MAIDETIGSHSHRKHWPPEDNRNTVDVDIEVSMASIAHYFAIDSVLVVAVAVVVVVVVMESTVVVVVVVMKECCIPYIAVEREEQKNHYYYSVHDLSASASVPSVVVSLSSHSHTDSEMVSECKAMSSHH